MCEVVSAPLLAMLVQLDPLSCEYCQPVMVGSRGFVQDSSALALPRVAVGFAGFAGSGGAPAQPDAAPVPVAFTARMRKRCSRPTARLLTVWEVVDAPLPGMSSHGVASGVAVTSPYK